MKKLLFIGILFFSVFKISQGKGFAYRWGHPNPQGNIINGIAFKNSLVGWAITGCGNILKTLDGGDTWMIAEQADTSFIDLNDVLITADGTIVIVGDKGLIIRSANEGQHWDTIQTTGNGNLYDLALVPDGGLSAAGENGVVLISTDDGLNWTDIGPGGSGTTQRSYWKSKKEGFLVGKGLFHHTVDGGKTWVQLEDSGTFGLNDIFFTDANTGYVVEDFAYWKTTDGGLTWEQFPQFVEPLYRYQTVVVDALHWYMVTNGEGAEVWETLDGGISWQLKFSYGSVGFTCIIKNNANLFIGSDIGDIFKSTDGIEFTNTVENLAVFPLAPITIFGRMPDGTLFANNQPNSGVDNGTFFKSTDSGNSWFLPPSTPGLRWVTAMEFYDNQLGVCGYDNEIRYTTDGGNTWQTSNLPDNYQLTDLALLSENTFYAAGYNGNNAESGNLFKSSDHGANWQKVSGGLPSNKLYLPEIAISNQDVFLTALINNNPEIYHSSDAGVSWTRINMSGIDDYISDMYWFSTQIGVAAVPNSEKGGIYRTSDGGLHWDKRSDIEARHFTSDGKHLAAIMNGAIVFQESADSGLTWNSYIPPFSESRSSFQDRIESIQSYENGYILGGVGNRILKATRDTLMDPNPDTTSMITDQLKTIIKIEPNPVTDHAEIAFEIAAPGVVNLQIFDIQGHLISTLIQQPFEAGKHRIRMDKYQIANENKAGVYILSMRINHVNLVNTLFIIN